MTTSRVVYTAAPEKLEQFFSSSLYLLQVRERFDVKFHHLYIKKHVSVLYLNPTFLFLLASGSLSLPDQTH